MAHIRDEIARCSSGAVAARVRLLYGGSVTPQNIDEFIAQAEVDGALVGGASLNPATFAEIVRRTGATAAA